jgi:hypothetical protein
MIRTFDQAHANRMIGQVQTLLEHSVHGKSMLKYPLASLLPLLWQSVEVTIRRSSARPRLIGKCTSSRKFPEDL